MTQDTPPNNTEEQRVKNDDSDNNKTEEAPSSSNGEPKGLIAWFAHNHVAANIMMMLFVIGGLVSVINMRTETFPSIDPRLITVSVIYPGATPSEIADSITNRVEEALLGIDGVKRIASKASEGYGLINIELNDFADADNVYNEVETSVNSLSEFPPQNAERPIITKVKPTPNVMTLALHGDVSEDVIKYWAESIESDIRGLSGVALTSLSGIRDYQISIEASEDTLRQYGLSLSDLSRIVAEFSSDIPAGTLESSKGEISLRVQERRYRGEEFERIAVTTLPNGSTLRLGDIATINDGFEDTNLISKFNDERAAFIEIKRSETEDTLEIAGIVKDYLETVSLPNGLSLSLQKDETVNLVDRINLMMRNGILGFMLVFIVLLLFLDLKLAFWVSIAVPISFLGGLMMIYFMGYSINMITLFALIVVLGIVVDDAIIVGESIFETQAKEGNRPNSVLRGVKRVAAPVTIGVATTMAAFLPLAFSTGTLGQIIGLIPIVVIPILFVSLLEAYFILPAHLSNPKQWSAGILAKIRDIVDSGLQFFIHHMLEPTAKFLLSWRYATIAAFFALAIITVAMVTSGTIRFLFFPNVEADEVRVTVTMPQGTPFATTTETLLEIEQHVIDVREAIAENGKNAFKSITVKIGETSSRSGPGGSQSGSSSSNVGEVTVQLVPSDFRSLSSKAIEDRIRARIEDLPGIETLEFTSSLIGDEPDIEIELSHPNDDILIRAADHLKRSLEQIEGTTDVTDSFKEGKTEYIFELTEEGLATGLTSAELGRQLRAAFFGLEAQRFQRGESEIIVYVRYPKEERESLSTLNQTRIRLADGREVPLSAVARIKEQTGFSQISTVNGRRVVSITSDVDTSVATPNEVIDVLNADILPDLKARFNGLSASFEGESRDQAEDLASLGQNMLIAVILIYVLLGGQLRSYIQPVVIMTAIPFGVVGAVWGHYFFGADLTFISLFGIVALTGVVVNDSVVLIDYLNSHLNAGKTIMDSCLIAIKRRFRPILLTTLTTSLGLLPMLLETSMQAKFLIPMVISLASGILFATVIIMFLVPSLILVIHDVKTCTSYISRILFKRVKEVPQ